MVAYSSSYLEKKVSVMNEDFDKMKDNTSSRINEVMGDLNKKGTIKCIEGIESNVYKKLDELMESLLKKFMTKEKSSKLFKELERHVTH